MTLLTKEYTFADKIAGSTVENKAVAKYNGIEFTQDQYDQILGSALELPNAPLPVLEFEFPYEESQVESVTIYFKSRVANGVITCECGDYGVFKRDNVYSQKSLNIYDGLVDQGTVKFKISSTDNLDIYEVKISVLYDDSTMRKYAGYIATGDDTNNNREYYNNLTKEQVVQKLQDVTTDNISEFAGTWQPVAGEIIP